MLRKLGLICAAILLTLAVFTVTLAQGEADSTAGYAPVNGMEMYYEIHGTGEPLIVLHGGYSSIVGMSPFITGFAETRQVIGVELQAHGRTADVADRPLTYEQMADDVAALLDFLDIEKIDVFGYSMGGGVAMQLAIRHPEIVDKLIVASMPYNSDGYHPGMMDMFETITPEMFAGTPLVTEYEALAPDPDGFAVLVEKLTALDETVQDWSPESIQGIAAPTLVIMGDADVITLEHTVELFRLRGGGANGDIVGLPDAQLAILPGTTHIGVAFRAGWIVPMVNEFLDGIVFGAF